MVGCFSVLYLGGRIEVAPVLVVKTPKKETPSKSPDMSMLRLLEVTPLPYVVATRALTYTT